MHQILLESQCSLPPGTREGVLARSAYQQAPAVALSPTISRFRPPFTTSNCSTESSLSCEADTASVPSTGHASQVPNCRGPVSLGLEARRRLLSRKVRGRKRV
eukprot:768292-Hanusia_phi.AAC.2